MDRAQLAARLKSTLACNVGPYVTCSIVFAANRQLAKMACKAGKSSGERCGDGCMVWRPEDLPAPLLALKLSDIPGVGGNMERRLIRSGICTAEDLYRLLPKHMRKLWNNVTGERLLDALHGYDVQAP
ncbi:nucleotidyltransferase/DNA polymerase involved in DNA repair [Mesorhizobium soli]|uniref:DNA polymerase thumb domain-containing protein n=1 Tax=Pseudaminobacter soli (ex Li et al. 2025) TaxID=1295366 RepID=UPI0024732142|nr:hypothetical protein [Mesorhizobium soli]MDH6234546.1 nucleotidyltransferase/DNA polymerase involved in DNA repair [Mesorhizobium soli]